MVNIVQKENKILRKMAMEVPPSLIDSSKIKKVIADMKKSLSKEPDGVAIAAPQIGSALRIFVVASKVFGLNKKKSTEVSAAPDKQKREPDMVFINPRILKASKDKQWMAEGCLSVRYMYGHVERSKKLRVRAYNEKGEVFEFGGSGLLAQIFQHEIDHLNGILFIDKAKDVVKLEPEKNAKKRA